MKPRLWGYLSSSIIFRDYFVSKHDFETVYETSISSSWSSSSITNSSPKDSSLNCWGGTIYQCGTQVS